ncbi:MAG: cyclase [Sulfobacillus acidophilus]|uniref:Kynurenine formamidase n=1 Tax=Sulfobacillus acidophilus TaxID=53633 RepID=A0A2T2WL35_9FIRM|nr:MAG: cyclase [Sulfobacillus acidophilus]
MYDLSAPIAPGMVVWPGDPPFEAVRLSSTDAGDDATVHAIRLSTHAGTHLDAPLHFRTHGAGVDQVPLDHCIGPVDVVDLDHGTVITADDLARQIPERCAPRLLLRTRNSRLSLMDRPGFDSSYVGLDLSAAQWLVDHEIRTVGIDYYSIEPYTTDYAVHRLLLDRGIAILEGVRLIEVTPGSYLMLAAPLRLTGLDGSPVRLVLLTPDEWSQMLQR